MRPPVAAWVIASLLAAASPGSADDVLMTNGDRITGTVVKMEDGVLTIRTPYAEELKVHWKDVTAVRTETPMDVGLEPDPSQRLGLSDLFFRERPLPQARRLGLGGDYPIATVRTVNIAPVFATGNATLGGNSTQGNTQTKAINAAARLSIRSHRQRVNLEAKYNYGEAQHHVTARNMTGGVEHNLFITPKTYLTVTGLLEKDSFQNLTLRTTFTGGAGYQLIETPRTQLSTEAGLGYVYEHFTTAEVTQTPSSRFAVRWQHAVVPDRLTLWQRGEAFYDLAGGNAVRARSDLGIRVAVSAHWFFNLEHDLRYNSQPAPGRLPTDHAFIFGIGYNL